MFAIFSTCDNDIECTGYKGLRKICNMCGSYDLKFDGSNLYSGNCNTGSELCFNAIPF